MQTKMKRPKYNIIKKFMGKLKINGFSLKNYLNECFSYKKYKKKSGKISNRKLIFFKILHSETKSKENIRQKVITKNISPHAVPLDLATSRIDAYRYEVNATSCLISVINKNRRKLILFKILDLYGEVKMKFLLHCINKEII